MIVQHVDPAFAVGLARWLSEESGRTVELIEPGDKPSPGKDPARIDQSTTSSSTSPRRFRYVEEPRDVHYRPSVDVFFRSVADRWPGRGVAALLTGMGRDGANACSPSGGPAG